VAFGRLDYSLEKHMENQTENHSTRNRRAFLAESARLTGAGWLALNLPLLLAAGQAAAEQAASGAAWANLSAQEAAVLAALADQIIPPDDLPGAAEIGVVQFIDQALGGFMSGESGMLREGLADLDRRALAAFPDSGGFAGLSFERQTAVVRDIETTAWFGLAIFLTQCGMFALPAWGGNRDGLGWDLLGFDSRHAWQPPFGHYDAGSYDAGSPGEEGGHGHG
jgi:gluconate 2-dehydrogenase gamma chain